MSVRAPLRDKWTVDVEGVRAFQGCFERIKFKDVFCTPTACYPVSLLDNLSGGVAKPEFSSVTRVHLAFTGAPLPNDAEIRDTTYPAQVDRTTSFSGSLFPPGDAFLDIVPHDELLSNNLRIDSVFVNGAINRAGVEVEWEASAVGSTSAHTIATGVIDTDTLSQSSGTLDVSGMNALIADTALADEPISIQFRFRFSAASSPVANDRAFINGVYVSLSTA
jgi:hypothetical protein